MAIPVKNAAPSVNTAAAAVKLRNLVRTTTLRIRRKAIYNDLFKSIPDA
jgi:hypothetical protein